MIDFKEITNSHKWELFCREFLRACKFEIIREPSQGQDTATDGYDLVVKGSHWGESFIWGVSCKHYAHSGKTVNQDDEKILNKIATDNYTGLIAFYSTNITSTLENAFSNIKEKMNKKIILYDPDYIEQELKDENGKLETIFHTYFPESYKEWQALGINDLKYKESDWHRLSRNDFDSKIDKTYIEKYYNGAPARWNIIEEKTFKRDIFHKIINCLEKDKIILIEGAGGEGKSTLLMQLGSFFYRNGYDVYFLDGPIKNMSDIFSRTRKKSTVLLIDNASDAAEIFTLLKLASLGSNIKVILASRTNEWNAYIKRSRYSKDISRMIDHIFQLEALGNKEIMKLQNLLKQEGVITSTNEEELGKIITDERNNFLLAIMLAATHGKPLIEILKDVIYKMHHFKNGAHAVLALGIIVGIESIMGNDGTPLYCPRRLLFKSMDVDSVQYKEIEELIIGEALLQQAKRALTTRNTLISKHYFEIIFHDTPPYLDLEETYYTILITAAKIDDKFSNYLLRRMPEELLNNNCIELATMLFNAVISFGYYPVSYFHLIQKLSATNTHLYNDENAQKVYLRHSDNPYAIWTWANFKWKQRITGGYYDEYSARWLLKKGIESTNNEQFYLKLAGIEEEAGGPGEYDEENSARWILKKGIESTNHEQLYLKLAEIEEEAAGGPGKYNEENSARWILKKGIESTNGRSLYLKLAEIEEEAAGGPGKYNEENSARWILKKGIESTNGSPLYLKLAGIEEEAGGPGEYDEENSARWILKKGIESTNHEQLYLKLAEIEEEAAGGPGKYNEENSARWILKKGIESTNGSPLYLKLAGIEEEAGGPGEYDEENSARWILKKGIESTNNEQLYLKLAKIEEEAGRPGEDNTKYSARWILRRGITKTNSGMLRRALEKLENTSMRSDQAN